MLNRLLAILPGDNSSWAGQIKDPSNYYFDNFGEAAIYALIGLGVVFLGIVIIIAIIWLVGLLMRKTNNLEFLTDLGKRKKVKSTETAVSAPEDKVSAVQSDDIPDEVKVAIIAAIMAYYQEKEDKCQFTVKRIKRI